MRAALISLPLHGEPDLPVIAGKSIAERQVAFAKAAGCEMIVAHGGGASAAAIALRHEVERAGMRFQVASNCHALVGVVGRQDSLLVIQPGLLPEARVALDLMRAEGDRVLIVSAGPGAANGFERIDLDRAWAGVLSVPGTLLDRLANLPEDAAPHAALLRIALQQRLPEARLADDVLDKGTWVVVASPEAAQRREVAWLRTHLGEESPLAPSRWFGQRLVAATGARLLASPSARPAVLALALGLAGGAVASAWFALPSLAFLLAGLSAPAIEMVLGYLRLGAAPFGEVRRWPALRYLTDASLLVSGMLAIDGLWFRAAFPPLVLVAALLLLDRRDMRRWLLPLRDRLATCFLLAVAVALVPPELAIIVVATLLVAANLASPTRTGITRA